MDAANEAPIKVGDVWRQEAVRVDENGKTKTLVRRVEVIGAPTPSSPVNVRILRNDAHPHRKGKVTSIRKGDLRAKYVPEG